MVVVSENPWHCSCVEFKRQMSKTWLWWFKFGIGGFYSNINEGWDESCIAHQLEEAHAPGMKPLSTAETAECVLPEVRTRACY